MTPEFADTTFPALKVCGVHNETDLTHVQFGGGKYVGVQLFNDEFRIETPAIRSMLQRIYGDNEKNTLPVFLAGTRSAIEISDILRDLLGENLGSPFLVQSDQLYSSDTVQNWRAYLEERGMGGHQYIQHVSPDTQPERTAAINRDPNVDYICIDSSKGTGKPIDLGVLANIAEIIRKPFFVAGGISSNNIGDVMRTCARAGNIPFAIDIRSSVRRGQIYPTESDIFERIDPQLVDNFQQSLGQAWLGLPSMNSQMETIYK